MAWSAWKRAPARGVPRIAGDVAIALAAALVLSACASNNNSAKLLNPDPPAKMYADADMLMTRGSYSEAAKKFEDVDRDHPY